jgi:hypothetical protein
MSTRIKTSWCRALGLDENWLRHRSECPGCIAKVHYPGASSAKPGMLLGSVIQRYRSPWRQTFFCWELSAEERSSLQGSIADDLQEPLLHLARGGFSQFRTLVAASRSS